ncbi:hypothetical protein HK096_005125, partial [Nowakowskiella sp. JEL0078]
MDDEASEERQRTDKGNDRNSDKIDRIATERDKPENGPISRASKDLNPKKPLSPLNPLSASVSASLPASASHSASLSALLPNSPTASNSPLSIATPPLVGSSANTSPSAAQSDSFASSQNPQSIPASLRANISKTERRLSPLNPHALSLNSSVSLPSSVSGSSHSPVSNSPSSSPVSSVNTSLSPDLNTSSVVKQKKSIGLTRIQKLSDLEQVDLAVSEDSSSFIISKVSPSLSDPVLEATVDSSSLASSNLPRLNTPLALRRLSRSFVGLDSEFADFIASGGALQSIVSPTSPELPLFKKNNNVLRKNSVESQGSINVSGNSTSSLIFQKFSSVYISNSPTLTNSLSDLYSSSHNLHTVQEGFKSIYKQLGHPSPLDEYTLYMQSCNPTPLVPKHTLFHSPSLPLLPQWDRIQGLKRQSLSPKDGKTQSEEVEMKIRPMSTFVKPGEPPVVAVRPPSALG